jgi:hypothetical protein
MVDHVCQKIRMAVCGHRLKENCRSKPQSITGGSIRMESLGHNMPQRRRERLILAADMIECNCKMRMAKRSANQSANSADRSCNVAPVTKIALNSVSSEIHSNQRGSSACRVKYRRVLMSSRDCFRKSSSSRLSGLSDVTSPLILASVPSGPRLAISAHLARQSPKAPWGGQRRNAQRIVNRIDAQI